MLALIGFPEGSLSAFDFGAPLEQAQTQEEHVRAILGDYATRKGELLDVGFNPALDILIKILEISGDQPSTILPPIRALGFLGRPQGAAAVAKFIRHSDRQVRLAVIRSLGQMGKFETIPLIEPFLRSLDRLERREAIIALGKFAKREVLPQVDSAAFGEPDLEKLALEARARIEATLIGIATNKYQPLVDAVIDTDEYEDLVALILVTWRPLLAVLEDETRSPETRERAMRLLAVARAKKAGPPMRKILADPRQSPVLRMRAAYGLGLLRVRSSVGQLAELLSGPDPRLREIAILSLGRIGDPRALEPLLGQWNLDVGPAQERLRLAIFRVRSPDAAESLLRPLRAYRPRTIAQVYFITDSLELVTGYRKELIEPYLHSRDATARRDALLLLATFATKNESAELQHYGEADDDPSNREIANLGVERLKDIPIWERS